MNTDETLDQLINIQRQICQRMPNGSRNSLQLAVEVQRNMILSRGFDDTIDNLSKIAEMIDQLDDTARKIQDSI